MRRSILVLGGCLILGFCGLPFVFYDGPRCKDIQYELGERVKAFISLHILDGSPSVTLAQSCGSKPVPDAMWFFYRRLAHHLGGAFNEPLNWQDLRIASTQSLLAHPDLGGAEWDVRLDVSVDKEKRLRVQEILGRYLKVSGKSSRLDFRPFRNRGKKLAETSRYWPQIGEKEAIASVPAERVFISSGLDNSLLLPPVSSEWVSILVQTSRVFGPQSEKVDSLADGQIQLKVPSSSASSTSVLLPPVMSLQTGPVPLESLSPSTSMFQGPDFLDLAAPVIKNPFYGPKPLNASVFDKPSSRIAPLEKASSTRIETGGGKHGWTATRVRYFLEPWRELIRVLITVLLLIFAYALLQPLFVIIRKNITKQSQKPLSMPARVSGREALFVPYFLSDWQARVEEMIAQWAPGNSRNQGIQNCLSRDQDAMFWSLIQGGPLLRTIVLDAFTPEQIMALNEFSRRQVRAPSLVEVRSLVRFMLMLAQEIGTQEKRIKQPFFLQLVTAEEWRNLACHLTRSRRRWLASRLGHDQAHALKLRSEPHFDWALTAPSQEKEEQVVQKVRSLLESHALAFRECIGIDREALEAIDSFFGQLSADPIVNAELAMVCLARIDMQSMGFSAGATSRDPVLSRTLRSLEPDLAAIALYDCDVLGQKRLISTLGEKSPEVEASLSALLDDRQQLKKWRMRSRTLQRFLERHIVIAKVFIRNESVAPRD